MDNIVIVVPSTPTYGKAPKVYQYNYGQILRIQGLNLPKVAEVHFSYNETYGDSVTRIANTKDGVTDVLIPDSFLEYNDSKIDYTVYAYIYLEDGTSGETVCKIDIPVKARSKPEVPGTPEEPELFRETVKAVNDAADRAEVAAQNAKASETEAGKYATSASESAATAEKTKEDALRKVGEKKKEAIEAVQEQEETSVGKITTHTDDEIQRILNQTAESKGELKQTIADADVSKEELEHSIETAGTSKTALDKSTELAGTTKTELDTSTQKAGEAKTALDESAKTACEMQETLNETVKQAGALDTSLGEKIKTGTQLKTDLTASGEKAVQDIQNAGSEQLGKMQAVAEAFAADREQINVNKEDISILKEEMSKNYLDDAKTKRSLDALWKLNQGISYQFETDAEKAYQKDIPSGAKLASVKKIGGRTIVWNQLFNYQIIKTRTYLGVTYTNNDDGTYTANGTSTGTSYISEDIKFIKGHKYYMRSLTTINSEKTYKAYITGNDVFRDMIDVGYGSINTALNTAIGHFVTLYVPKGATVENLKIIPQIYDLTQMFGAGNEPSTPEEFEALFLEDYYPYNEGELMSMPVNEVVEQGKNLFDEKMELGLMNYDVNFENFGENIASKNQLRSSNYIPVEPNTQYFFNSYRAIAFIYDAKRKPIKIGSNGYLSMGSLFTTPSNARYLKFYLTKEYGIIYNSDLILTKGATTAYSPYHKNTYPIPQAILNLDGYGDGVSDDVYNYVDWENKEYHKRVGRVDLGTLPWINYRENDNLLFVTNKLNNSISKSICSKYVKKTNASIGKEDKFYYFNPFNMVVVDSSYSDANDFKVGIQGVMLYYNLAEEEIIDISDIIDSTFQEPIEVEAGGTLTFQNSNGDGYRLPIPNEEEYIVSLAEVGGGASE